MSKHKALDALLHQEHDLEPEPVKVQVRMAPLRDCIGKMVECPDCKHPARVDHPRGLTTLGGDRIPNLTWIIVRCEGSCGSVQRKGSEMVTVLGEMRKEPRLALLAAAVGKWVACPGTNVRTEAGLQHHPCGERSMAQFRTDLPGAPDGHHVVVCPVHQVRPWPADEVVEVLE